MEHIMERGSAEWYAAFCVCADCGGNLDMVNGPFPVGHRQLLCQNCDDDFTKPISPRKATDEMRADWEAQRQPEADNA